MRTVTIFYFEKPKHLEIEASGEGKSDSILLTDVDVVHFHRMEDYPKGVPAKKMSRVVEVKK